MGTALKCVRAWCTGTIDDGYCDVCGLPPAPGPYAPARARAPAPARTEESAHTQPSGERPRGMPAAGLAGVPPVPYRDPASAVLADPEVPEHKRFCGGCDEPVGRGSADRPGRTHGYCAKCGARYSFVPRLSPGDVVAAQYEVLGCLAHGGTGWVYLARDMEVSGRWVALKGMLASGDPDLPAAAVAERGFLAEVQHPNIVEIYNFVRHFGAGYIVMEYVGGRSLKDIVLERRRAGESPPLAHVLEYGLEALGALDHLHGLGLLYCDFKPDNAIHAGDRLKLIDLGGVRRIDDPDGPVYGTVGYQAPEIAERGPSIASDLYTVARTMAVLSFEFTGYTNKYRESLPERYRVGVLSLYESYDRLLRRATHPDPDERFGSAAEMAGQVAGVLAEVLADTGGEPRPWRSGLFTPGPSASAAGPGAVPPAEEAARALAVPAPPAGGTGGWADDWEAAIGSLLMGEVADATGYFDRVYGLLPGESAPKLALALCAELRGDLTEAARFHETVWRTDPSNVSAAFGLARTRFARMERAAAMEALDSVPDSSRHHADAQIAAIVATLWGRDPAGLGREELVEAAERLEGLGLTGVPHRRLTVLILRSALDWLDARPSPASARPGSGDTQILGVPLAERALRRALEHGYRELARMSDARRDRVALVELANAVRPMTVF